MWVYRVNDSRITRVSDLLELEGVKGNVTLTIVSDSGEIKLTESAGDSGDIPVTGGQSFILVAREAATIEIRGTGWSTPSGQPAASPMVRPGIELTDITPGLSGEWFHTSTGRRGNPCPDSADLISLSPLRTFQPG